MANKEGILWVNDQGTWLRADDVHPFGRKTTFKEPFQLWGKLGSDWYTGWPVRFPTAYPPVTNLRATAVSSTSITVAWDAITSPAPIRYRGQWAGPGIGDTGSVNLGTATTATMSGLTAASQYTFAVWGEFAEGNGDIATLTVTTGTSTPPSITSWTPRNYNTVDMVVAGTNPLTLRCVGGSRNGQTYSWSAGANAIGVMVGKEYWQIENAGGVTARFYTDDGTAAQSGTTGAVRTSLANPLPSGFGRGSCAGLAWGDAPAMSAHPNFPYSNTNDGTGATRFQTGNYARGWVQHVIGIPGNYRVRRFMFVQGDGAGNTEMVTPVYSVDSGASFKRYSHFGGTWVPATDATVHPGTASPNGLLSIDSQGNWNRDWNWQLTSSATLTTPFIPENGTDLSQRWIYVRWGIVHQTGSFGANMGECWIEYQEPSTPAKAEVKCTIAWG